MPRTSFPSFSLSGKVIVLTGGAGLYGRGLAACLAHTGAVVVLAARNRNALIKVAEEETQLGHHVEAESLDQGEEQSVLSLCERVLSRHGRVDGLVNNAVLRPMAGLHDPLERWEQSMRVNATGLFAMLRTFGAAMARQGSGSIVNISSIQGMVGANLWLYEGTKIQTLPDYFFHKGGMINLTRYFAAQLGPRDVRVNCVSPGGFYNNHDQAFVKRYSQMTMLGRMAGDNDIDGAIVFLLSDASKYITGVNLPIDGGYTAK